MIPRDLRVIPTAALTATALALVAFVLMQPRVAMWAVVIALVLAICGLFTLAKESIDLRAELDNAERKNDILIDILIDALMAADQENAILSGRLEDVARVPLVPFRSLPKAERDHIASAPRLHVVADEHARADDDFFGRLYGRDDKGNLL